ncbi:unnamed protein product [Rhizophagus irregularis]|nr:unnamed protein product [Rhizophagus irregularis]CAB5387928.1 unnamed protein product [Rhizophagus irregularis]
MFWGCPPDKNNSKHDHNINNDFIFLNSRDFPSSCKAATNYRKQEFNAEKSQKERNKDRNFVFSLQWSTDHNFMVFSVKVFCKSIDFVKATQPACKCSNY